MHDYTQEFDSARGNYPTRCTSSHRAGLRVTAGRCRWVKAAPHCVAAADCVSPGVGNTRIRSCRLQRICAHVLDCATRSGSGRRSAPTRHRGVSRPLPPPPARPQRALCRRPGPGAQWPPRNTSHRSSANRQPVANVASGSAPPPRPAEMARRPRIPACRLRLSAGAANQRPDPIIELGGSSQLGCCQVDAIPPPIVPVGRIVDSLCIGVTAP